MSSKTFHSEYDEMSSMFHSDYDEMSSMFHSEYDVVMSSTYHLEYYDVLMMSSTFHHSEYDTDTDVLYVDLEEDAYVRVSWSIL